MYTVVSDLSSIDDFQLHLNSINTWSILWQLPIAHSKCTLFHIGSRYNPSPNHSFTLGNTPLLKSDTVTDLGILFDDTFKFQNHIHIISRRAHLCANLIHRCIYSKNPTLLVRAYKVYVRHLLEYNPFIWSPSLIALHYITLHYITLHYITLHYITLHYITLHYRHFKRHLHLKWPVVHQQLHVIRNTAHRPSTQASYTASRVRPKRKVSCAAAQIAATLTISFPRWHHMSLTSYWGQQRMSLTSYPGHWLIGLINTVENVQRHFTKRIPGLHSLSYAERLYNLKLQSLEHRRLICDLIYCFKIVHNLSSDSFDSFFSFSHNSASRGHPLRLSLPLTKNNTEKSFFSNRVIKPWNSLSSDIVLSSNINIFKLKISKYDLSKFLIFPSGPLSWFLLLFDCLVLCF